MRKKTYLQRELRILWSGNINNSKSQADLEFGN